MQELRERFEAYRIACERERWRLARDPGEGTRYAEIDDRFADLCSGEPLDGLRKPAAATGELEEAQRKLALGIEDAVVAARTRSVTVELRARVRAHRVRAGGFEGNERDLQARLGLCEDADERERLAGALERALAEHEELRLERAARLSGARTALGYRDGLAFLAARSPGLEPTDADLLAQGVLERSEPAFRDAAARVRWHGGSHAELAPLRRAAALDRALPADRHAAALGALCAPLGRLGDLRGVTLEPARRAACHPLELPGDVRLALPRASGLGARVAAFEAAGRALHCAWTSPALPVERRRVIDPALVAGFGWLLGLRALDPLWLEEVDAGRLQDVLLARARFERLLRWRMAAALARVELALLGAPEAPADLGRRFAEELERATGARFPEPAALALAGPEGRALARLRGFVLEAMLGERLRSRGGRRFWREARAFALLEELWNTGATYDAAALGRELGFPGLDPTPLLDACAVR